MQLTGMLNRKKDCLLRAIQTDTGDLTLHGTDGKAGGRFVLTAVLATVARHKPAAVVAEHIAG